MKEGGQVEDSRKGFGGREVPCLQPLHSECKHCVLAKRNTSGGWVWPLGSGTCNCWPILQVQAPAHSLGGLQHRPLTCAEAHFLLLDALVLLNWCRHLPLSPFRAFAYVIPLPGTSSTHPFYHYLHFHLTKSYLFFNIHLRCYQLQGFSSWWD